MKLVIFDLDGTLADSIESITYCGNYALKQAGLRTFEREDYQYFVGDGVVSLVSRMVKAAGDEKLKSFDLVKKEYDKIFEEYCMYEVRPYPGIVELLEQLKQRNLLVAVLSNKPHARTIDVIHALFGKHVFDAIQGQQDGVLKKPSPEGVFEIAKQLEVDPSEILYLGDTDTDMKTGKSAGAYTLGVLWGFRKQDELIDNGADAIIENPLDALLYLG